MLSCFENTLKKPKEQIRSKFIVPAAQSYAILLSSPSKHFRSDEETKNYVKQFFLGEEDKRAWFRVKILASISEVEFWLYHGSTPGSNTPYVFCLNSNPEEMKEILENKSGFGASIVAGFESSKYWMCNKWDFNYIPPSSVTVLTHESFKTSLSGVNSPKLL